MKVGPYSERAQFSRHTCEDCGEAATRLTADGVWLCDGDMDALCYASEGHGEGVAKRSPSTLKDLPPTKGDAG